MPEPKPEFEIIHWRGQVRYKCPHFWESGALCEYDSHDLELIRKHAATPHTFSGRAIAGKRTEISPILGPGGETIVREIVDPRFADVTFKPEEQ